MLYIGSLPSLMQVFSPNDPGIGAYAGLAGRPLLRIED
jgi:hypothetical protein